MGTVIAVSWSGSLFFATIEPLIPNSMVKTKTYVKLAKAGFAAPIVMAEWTTHKILGGVEILIIGNPLPINVTDVYGLKAGPNIPEISSKN